jgi:DNA-binding response OmpR family regulator
VHSDIARQSVLIVDDEPLFLSSIREGLALRRSDIEVLGASHGQEALDIIRARPVDLLVTDLHMPVLDGFELLSRLMRERSGTPVIVMTAFGTPEIEENVRGSGAVAYVEKPIDLALLNDMIDRELRRAAKGHIQGITLCGFLQLLEVERKTCTLLVSSDGRTGFLHFQDGELIHAEMGETSGPEVVYALENWTAPEIEIDQVCRARGRTVFGSVTELLLEGARRADEETRSAERGPDEEPFDSAAGWEARDLSSLFEPKHDDRTTQSTAAVEPQERWDGHMANLKETLTKMSEISGFLGACIVDSSSGMMLGAEGGGSTLNLEVAAAGNTEVVRAKRKTIASLGLKDTIEDILITLGKQYHLIRPLSVKDGLFAYLVLDKAKSNLAMARLTLAEAEKELTI